MFYAATSLYRGIGKYDKFESIIIIKWSRLSLLCWDESPWITTPIPVVLFTVPIPLLLK